MKIGQLYFDKLNGPTYFTVLQPSDELIQLLNRYIPPLIMIGDYHERRDNLCDIKPFSTNILSTFTPMWLRLMDSLTTDKIPIKYYIEGYIPDQMLNTTLYMKKELRNWNYQNNRDTIMNYIPIYHQECLSTNPQIVDDCLTKNIEYKLIDWRLGNSNARLTSEDYDKNKIKSYRFLEQNMFKKKKYKDDKQLKISQKRKLPIYENFIDVYESYVVETITHRCDNINFINRSNKINNKSVFNIIKLAYKDPRKCAETLFDIYNNQVKSGCKLYKIADDMNCLELAQNMFIEYFIQIMKYDKDIVKIKDTLFDAIQNFDIYYSSLQSLFITKYSSYFDFDYTEIPTHSQHIANVYKKTIDEYQRSFSIFAATISIPFIDLYALFDSWKNPNILSVYNAGDFHIRNLYKILTDHQLYKSIYVSDSMFIRSQHIDVSRCLEFDIKFNLDIDHLIISHLLKHKDMMNNHDEIIQSLYEKHQLNLERKEFLGDELYQEMLQGLTLSKEQIDQICLNNQTNYKNCLAHLEIEPELELKFSQKEYIKNKKIKVFKDYFEPYTFVEFSSLNINSK